MGNNSSFFSGGSNDKKLILRIMTYNVEWGFIDLPTNIHKDANNNDIPFTKKAQYQHLTLCAKTIGTILPDICFLQEIGSLQALNFLSDAIDVQVGIRYKIYYSNGGKKGDQGVGLLIKEDMYGIEYNIAKIPGFEKGLGLSFLYHDKQYKIVGVHLKSLFGKVSESNIVKIQIKQLECIHAWVVSGIKADRAIICGDFNNTRESDSVKLMMDYKYIDIIDTDKYIENISSTKATGTYTKKCKKHSDRIDYVFATSLLMIKSVFIVPLERHTKKTSDNNKKGIRVSNSDHLPVVAIVAL